MTTPNTDPLVEQIARALDPWIWTDEDDDPNTFRRLVRRDNRLAERPASLERARAVLPIVDAAVRRGQAEAWNECADRIEIDGGRESAWTDHLREHNPYREETPDEQ